MLHADKQRLVAKLDEAKAKVAITVRNDAVPSKRLLAAVILLNQVIDELRGDTYAGPPTPTED